MDPIQLVVDRIRSYGITLERGNTPFSYGFDDNDIAYPLVHKGVHERAVPYVLLHELGHALVYKSANKQRQALIDFQSEVYGRVYGFFGMLRPASLEDKAVFYKNEFMAWQFAEIEAKKLRLFNPLFKSLKRFQLKGTLKGLDLPKNVLYRI